LVQETQKIENSHPACDCAMRPRVPILRVIFDVFEYQTMFNCSFFFPSWWFVRLFTLSIVPNKIFLLGWTWAQVENQRPNKSCLNRWFWPKDVNMSKEALGIKDNSQDQVPW